MRQKQGYAYVVNGASAATMDSVLFDAIITVCVSVL